MLDQAFKEQVKEIFSNTLEEMRSFNATLEDSQTTDALNHGDEGDVSQEQKQNEFNYRFINRHTTYKKKIIRALKKMDEGTYGQCEECSAPIALARLLARPTADLCIQCKEVEELREKQQMVSMIS